jgi:hypothetical protein
MIPRSLPAAVIVAAALASSPASAQVSEADRALARTLAQQGQDAIDAADFATAIDRFTRADAIVHAPTLLLGLARAQAGLGKLTAAHATYRRIVQEGVPSDAKPVFVKAVGDARKELAALEARLPSVIVQIEGASAVRVSIDGAPIPDFEPGKRRPLDPGPHTLRAEADGMVPAEAKVIAVEGKSESLKLTLVARAVGGDAARSTLKIAGIASLGAGGVGLLIGAVAGGVAVGKHADLAPVCPSGLCTGRQREVDSYHLVTGLSTAGFVAGGALAAAGAVLLILAPKAKPSTQARIAPLVGPGFAGAEGRF